MNNAAQVRIAPAAEAELPELIALSGAAAEAAHWSEQQWREVFESQVPRRLCWIARSGSRDAPAGFVVALCAGADWELENMAVAPDHRRRRVGSALMMTLLDAARHAGAERVLLEVRASNSAAIGLYTQVGFQPIGTRPGYYRNPPEDALILARRM